MNKRTEKFKHSENRKKNPLARRKRGALKELGPKYYVWEANENQVSHSVLFRGYFRNVTKRIMRNKYCKI